MQKPSIVQSMILVASLAAWTAPLAQTIDSAPASPSLRETIATWQHQPPGPELTVGELTLDPDANSRRHITRSAAVADVDRFFHLLEHGYCGYGYFSREHDFGVARAAILTELGAHEAWSTRDLAELIREHLDFVADAHLKLGHVQFADHQDFWVVPDLELAKQGQQYSIAGDAEGQAIVTVNDRDPEGYVFSSLDPDGRSIRVLATLSASEPLPLRVAIATETGVSERSYRLMRTDCKRRELFRFFRLGGIPVVRIGTFSDHHVEETRRFLDTADNLRDEPCVIVDLRGNGGGNTKWAKEWIRRFTGRTPELHQALTALISRTTLVGQMNYFAWLAAGPGRAISDQLAEECERLAARIERFDDDRARPSWQIPWIPDRPPIPNGSTLIVVTDAAVASSGEGFISYLHDQVENVVQVGENTRGAITFGHMSAHRLPGSGLLAFIPVKLNLPLDLTMREERGFDPDYWVPADDALNCAVAAIRSGTIPTAKPLPQAVLATEFVPESPPRFSRAQMRRSLQVVAVLMAVVAFGIANRRRGPIVFVLSAAVLVIAATIGFAGNPPARWLALLGGAGHGVLAGYKGWRMHRARDDSPT